MREVSKEQFKQLYFAFGRGEDGWSPDYWESSFEKQETIPMKYLVQEPESPRHNRMMIVSDFSVREYRLFFLTEEAEEGIFRQ